MGDVGRGMFVLPGVPELIRDAGRSGGGYRHAERLRVGLPGRDGGPAGRASTIDLGLLEAVADGSGQGSRETVLVTSVGGTDLPDDEIAMLAVDRRGA